MGKVKQYTEKLEELYEEGFKGTHTERKVKKWNKRLKGCKEESKPTVAEVTRPFAQNYGRIDWRHWRSRVVDNVVMDAKVFDKNKGTICYFKKFPKDFSKEQAGAMLEHIMGPLQEEHASSEESKGEKSDSEVSKGETSDFSSLLDLYLEQSEDSIGSMSSDSD